MPSPHDLMNRKRPIMTRLLPSRPAPALAFLLFALTLAVPAAEMFVAPGGGAGSPGTNDKPFATLIQARDAIRALKRAGPLRQPVTVTVRGGVYVLDESFSLGAADAGAAEAPITYQAAPGERVVLDGGRAIDVAAWKPLAPEARRRVHPKVDPARLVALDLRQANFKHVAPWGDRVRKIDLIGLFVNGRRMPLAQWPNAAERYPSAELPGWSTMNGSASLTAFYYGAGGQPQDGDATDEVGADGSGRIERWRAALAGGHPVFLKGFWRVPWTAHLVRVSAIDPQARTITLAANADGGMGSKYSKPAGATGQWRLGSGKEMWQALNLLEEIDAPGEYAIDFKDGMLYFYPPARVNTLRCVIADLAEPLIELKAGADHIRLVGFTLQHGLGDGVKINDASGVRVAGCTICNVNGDGIAASGRAARNLEMCGNDICQTGGAGMRLSRLGDRAALTPSGCAVINNHIHHVGRVGFDEGISMTDCVGVTVAHNLIHDGPARGVVYSSCNNCLFEKNEIHNIALETSDMGAFYAYGGWSTYGNVLRGNLIHHISNANGIYFDDGDSGDTAEENVISGALLGFLVGGGHHNIMRRNLIIGAARGAVHIDNRGISRNYRVENFGRALRALKVDRDPWKSYYAAQAAALGYEGTLDGDVLNPAWRPEYPNGCRAEANVAVACKSGFAKPKGPSGERVMLANNLELQTEAEAGLQALARLAPRTDNRAILQRIPALNGIAAEAGLVLDEYRRSLPSDAATGRFSDHRGGAGGRNEDPDAQR